MPELTPRVVFDCNLFVQGIANRNSPARKALRLFFNGDISLFVSEPIIREVRDVLNREELRRQLPGINDRNYAVRSRAEREAINMPIQGSASDIVKIAMINVFNALRSAGLVAQTGVASIVVDCESGPVRLGLASRLAAALGGPCLRLEELSAENVAGVVRAVRDELTEPRSAGSRGARAWSTRKRAAA